MGCVSGSRRAAWSRSRQSRERTRCATRCAKDEGASRLGELALVDREGRIGKSGITYFNTLLDENAASHFALGGAYATSVDEEDRARINKSVIHIDFMIGSDDVAVTGPPRGRHRGAGATRRELADLEQRVARRARAFPDQLRLAALGERDLDHVEVARRDGRARTPPAPPRATPARSSEARSA